MSGEAIIVMIVIIGGYVIGATVLLNKVFKSQQAKR
jgi:hypothetical protein